MASSLTSEDEWFPAALILQHRPPSQEIMLARAGLAAACLKLGDSSSAETEATTLLSAYSEHQDFAKAVNWLADQYFKASDNSEAIQLYQLVLSKNPASNDQLIAHGGLACIYVRSGDGANADEEIEEIRRDFIQEPDIGNTVLEVGEEYYLRGEEAMRNHHQEQAHADFEKSAALIEHDLLGIIETDPNGVINTDDIVEFPTMSSNVKSDAWYLLGLAYQQLKDYSKAAQAFADSYQNNPDFQYADYCLYAQGSCYEKLIQTRQVSQTDVKPLITSAYSALISKYPTSIYVEHIQKWLQDNK